MPTSFATIADVESAWRALTDAETTVATTQLRYASAIIRSRVTDIDDRIAAGTLDADMAEMVAVAMVKRLLLNPESWRQEAIEDFSRTRDSAVSTGALYISDEEIALLSKRGSRAFSVALGTEPASYGTLAAARANQLSWRT